MKRRTSIDYIISEILKNKKKRFSRLSLLTFERHIADLKRSDFDFYFDADEGLKAIRIIETFHHLEGAMAGELLLLTPWQKAIIYIFFGWRRKSDTKRRFKDFYLEVARKNGKTTLGACIALYVWLLEGEKGAQAVTAATKRDQAKISWKQCVGQIIKHPQLKELVVCKNYQMIKRNDMFTTMKAMGRESKSEDGLNIYVGLIDEYHAHPTDDMVEVLRSSMRARKSPLMIYITTAGFNKNSPCFDYRESAIKVLEGTDIRDDLFAILFCLDVGDNWDDEKNWVKANPNMDVEGAFSIESMRADYNHAKQNPKKINKFKTQYLNIWTEAQTAWISMDTWDACTKEFTFDHFKNKDVICSIDMSACQDLTSICYATIADEDNVIYLWWKYWLPAQNIIERSRRDKVPYDMWKASGLLYHAKEGIIRESMVFDEVLKDSKEMNIIEIAYDPRFMTSLADKFEAEEFNILPINQTMPKLSPFAKTFENKVFTRAIVHNGNPITRWMVGCTEVESKDDMIKPIKPARNSQGKRIDGVVTAMIATARSDALSNNYSLDDWWSDPVILRM